MSCKTFILIILFGILITPSALPQASEINSSFNTENTELSQQTNDDSDNEKKKDKKKDKKKSDEKEEIKIDENFFISLLINLVSVFIIIVLIFFQNYKKQEVFFTFFLFNISIFLLTFLLNQIKISIGAAFGLFAVFSMLRYRTENISTKDMTYLFVVITVGLISAVKLNYLELCIINGIIILAVYILDGNIFIKREYSNIVRYENIELIKPEHNEKLIEDLKFRTGLNIHRISINKIDYLSDSVWLDVFYYNSKCKKSIKKKTD